jgi:alcohol dehydrogenase (quinone), cytochrome c subunit
MRVLIFTIAVAIGLLVVDADPAPPAVSVPDVLENGSRVYGDNCASCHGADGAGIPGDSPPMQDDAVVAGDPIVLIRIMTQGTGKVIPQQQRSRYTGVMPVDYKLNDDQIAALLTYMRHDFGENASPVTAAQVVLVRKQYGGFDSTRP